MGLSTTVPAGRPASRAGAVLRGAIALALACAVPGAGAATGAGGAAETTAYADEPTRVWINPGIRSWHFDRDKPLRENNYGLGVEVALNPEHVLLAGRYRNSNDAMTSYATWYWRPLHWGRLHVGAMLGAFDGYPKMRDGGWFPALLPAASYEFDRVGVNFTIVPSYKDRLNGAIAVQLKLRVW